MVAIFLNNTNSFIAAYENSAMEKRKNREKEELIITFGKNLRKIRLEKGIKTSELASRCEMERHHINRYENGKINPTLYAVLKMAKAMEVSIDELLEGCI
jgi:putative transcriptional regulator